MIHAVCAVRDAKAECFGQPFFAQQRGIAIRSFSDECSNDQSNLKKHPEDYALFFLGEFNDSDGSFSPCQPVQICHALDFVKQA